VSALSILPATKRLSAGLKPASKVTLELKPLIASCAARWLQEQSSTFSRIACHA
jgi:hypothetical protein